MVASTLPLDTFGQNIDKVFATGSFSPEVMLSVDFNGIIVI